MVSRYSTCGRMPHRSPTRTSLGYWTTTEVAALLDVNVLVALSWPNHVHHGVARAWFTAHASDGWATTPFTEAGFTRVSSVRTALPTMATPETAIEMLTLLTGHTGHEFWLDDVPLVIGSESVGPLLGHRQVTDAHLLALAISRSGRLVTFDAGIRSIAHGLPHDTSRSSKNREPALASWATWTRCQPCTSGPAAARHRRHDQRLLRPGGTRRPAAVRCSRAG